MQRRFLFVPFCFGLACAGSGSATAPSTAACTETPEPEAVASQTPAADESVSVRLFVVAPSGSPDTGMPEAIVSEPVCSDGVCEVLYAPLIVGREHTDMVLEIADRKGLSLLSVNAKAGRRADAIDVELDSRFVSADGPMRVEFRGALRSGRLTHVGTFTGRDAAVGPHVYAQVVASGA